MKLFLKAYWWVLWAACQTCTIGKEVSSYKSTNKNLPLYTHDLCPLYKKSYKIILQKSTLKYIGWTDENDK